MATERVNEALADTLVGQSESMAELRRRLPRLAACDVNLLLHGESGTGKELIARTVHDLSGRGDGPFIGVNCAAIHETLLESELFGHEAGAFTGAQRATPGLLRAADGGTILLDEVGDMSGPLQSKLLRVLEQRAVTPVGGTRAIPIEVRVIAATHHDLSQGVGEGTFRRDLYYRLNVVRVSIPPLRARREDIPLLARHMAERMAEVLKLPVKRISPEAMALFMAYDWPGNVRQLGNAIQHAYVLGDGRAIRLADLPEELLGGSESPAGEFPTLREINRQHVRRALQAAGGVRERAARLLGIDRKSLWRFMRRHSMT